MPKALVMFAAVLWGGAVEAADRPTYASPPAWVRPTAIPDIPAPTDGSALQTLLADHQARFGPDGDDFYNEQATRILTPQGLPLASKIALSWNPQVEALTVHRLDIIRGGRRISILAGGKTLTILRRETNLELAMLDGDLTATIQPEGVRVGDVIDIAFTDHRRDPLLQGHSWDAVAMGGLGVLGRVHFRALRPKTKILSWKTTKGLATPSTASTPERNEAVIDLTGVRAPKSPEDAPPRFTHPGQWELSDFSSWGQVSALVAPLYAQASTLAPASPLRAEAAKIMARARGPLARASLALALVQQQIRYVFLGMNLGGYVPAAADVTWVRRFGDCKGKTALLLALLHELGIEAQPALVSTAYGDGLDERAPMMAWFDHVIVRAVIAGKAYWLDGTRTGDRGVDDIPAPGFRWVLPVHAPGVALEKIDQPPFREPQTQTTVHLDTGGGIDAQAPARVEELFRGDSGLYMHLALASLGQADAERFVKEFWTRAYPWIDVSRVEFTYDETSGVTRLAMTGMATMDWASNGDAKQFDIGESNLGARKSFKREPGPDADAPFAVNYPTFDASTVTIALPHRGAGFHLGGGADVDKTIAGVAYHRRSRLDAGVVTMEASTKAVASEFPFSQAQSARTELRDLARSDVLVEATSSGPVQYPTAIAPSAVEAQSQPKSAAGFSGRGVGFLLARDYDRAIADFTSAARLEPRVAKHFYNRGVAHFEKGESKLAIADFNHALNLNPNDDLALSARGLVHMTKGDEAAARNDFDEAIRRSPGRPGALWRAANVFLDAGRFEAAIGYYSRLIDRFPGDSGFAQMLSARCWARAAWGRELENALADCNASLKLRPGQADVLDSRGFAELRLGAFEKAVADYDAALRQSPNRPPSLYGRGLAKLDLGQTAAGQADMVAAKAIDPKVVATFASYGVKP